MLYANVNPVLPFDPKKTTTRIVLHSCPPLWSVAATSPSTSWACRRSGRRRFNKGSYYT